MMTFRAEEWAGKQFKCTETGEILTIPADVRPKSFYQFGNCFVDVGDGYYSRMGGNLQQLEDPLVDPDYCRDAALRRWDNR
jgi:hypothetical protein